MTQSFTSNLQSALKKSMSAVLVTTFLLTPMAFSYAATTTTSKTTSTKSTAVKTTSKTAVKTPAKVTAPSKKIAVANPVSAPFEISGWIPYWRTATGTADVLPHLSILTEVNPFGYTVKNDGTLFDAMNVQDPAWLALKTAASSSRVRYIPSVMWSDTAAIHNVLSNPTLRKAHEQSIAQAVIQNGYDGIDIDYEGKSADDRANFTLFLKEMSELFAKKNMNKWLMCTIEARQPLTARYSGTPPAGIEYANDLPSINKYCDRVRLMTYDQQNADIQLNAQHAQDLYMPVADTAWVAKVVNYMAADIDKKKMVIGVATYGDIYQAMPNVDGSGYTYDNLGAFNPGYATALAAQYGITPTRNSSGEMSFSYVPKETSSALPSNSILSALAPVGTLGANLAGAGALALASAKHQQAPVQYLVWSDATSVQQKIALAKQLGVRGVAVFKFDGGEDQNIWNILK
jgi:spore germination protein YaaH